MKAWEKLVSSSRRNLWLVTTQSQKLTCVKVKGEFFVKAPIKTLIPDHYILSVVKL